ncbi:hypothetical protein V6M85_05585 [Sulfolobus tengchongensis]|uniref:Uncharacterized protein n=1 Tax=Sulfolobus tengchongensis TaxID=207809 RepID=A0AAX4L4F4_9CREN
MGLLEVYSNPERPEILCSLVDDKGNKKEIMLIKLQDNGVHIYKTEEHYILPPVPQIDSLIRDVIEEVAEELKVDSIVYNYGDIDTNSETLRLSNEWFDVERLALASSKHIALSSDVNSKIIVGIVKFSNNTYAATVLRSEDSFPILQIFMDMSYNPPLVKIYNELGQVIESRRENIDNFEEYVKSLINNEEEYTIIYREFIEYNLSPAENSIQNGKKIYAGCIFKYLIGFNIGKKPNVIKKHKLSRLLRAILYLDRVSNDVGVDIVVGNPSSIVNLSEAISKLKAKVNNIASKKYGLNNVHYYGVSSEIIKDINMGSKDVLNVIPIAFIILADSKKKFEEYVERIISGPTVDGLELLDEYIRQNLSNTFIAYLANLEEVLILYNDIIQDLDSNESE